jgi:cell division protein FtsB
MFTVRAMVLAVVLLMAFVVLFPTVRESLAQRASLQSLRDQVAMSQTRNANLTAELARWKDPAYVAAQARERLAFVLPGETPFRVIDPETVTALKTPTKVAAALHGPALPADGTTEPWYARIWTSVQLAGDARSAG